MRAVSYLVFSLVLLKVACVSDVLRKTQPLYGISTLAEDVENKTCHRDLYLLRDSVDLGKVWAIKAIDASGRLESGFIYGNNLWIGSHAQCREISNTKPLEVNNEKIMQLQTPYDYPPYPMGFAIIYVKHNSTLQRHTQQPLEWTIQLGVCVPKSCSESDIFDLAEKYFTADYLEVKEIYNISMELVEVRKLDGDNLLILSLPKTIILAASVVIILMLTIIGTTYDIRRNKHRKLLADHNISCMGKSGSLATIELVSKGSSEELSEQSILSEILQCFSFTSNTKNLLKTKLAADAIGCIHGLRFISMLWVVAVHSIFYQADFIKNVPFAYRLSENLMSQTFTNSTYCVDSYLFLSGFLVAYLFFKSKNPHEKSNKPTSYSTKTREYFMMWINRFCRLTPPYMMVLLLTDVIFTYYRQNSSLTSWERPDIVCDKYWWRNLLYINNLFPRSEMCLSWSWYLSLDTQFFTITTFLLILSTIVFKVAAGGTFLLIVGAMVVTGWKSYTIGYIPTMDEQLVQLDAIYDLPWNRIGPYLVGVITGYILKIKLENKLMLSKKMLIFLWTVFPLLNIWIVFTLYTRQLTVEFSAVYMGISRTLWGVGLAWVVIACCTGNANTINKFLSFRGFIPLSRITYCVYLLNPVAANMIYLGMESTFEVSIAEFAFTVCGITLISFYMAFLFSVMVESPFILLTKIAIGKLTTKAPKSESTPET